MITFIKKRKITLTLLTLLLITVFWTFWGNSAIEVNHITISSKALPEPFNGFRIAHVSDLHNTQFGENNKKLLSLLHAEKPDIIAITGDLLDSYNTNIDVALAFAHAAVKIAPTYFVSGNHEARIDEYAKLREDMIAAGIEVLDDRTTTIAHGGRLITLVGVIDPSFNTDYLTGDSQSTLTNSLNTMLKGDSYTILLSHRPELFNLYVHYNIDLVLSGHAHGGQFRLPFIGGLVAPNQGFFPKYDAGLFTDSSTNMIVSRGLGNSIIPLRFNNRPEIIIVELRN